MKTLAYLRVSKDTQDVRNQKLAILEFAQQEQISVDQFVEVTVSSRKSTKERRIDQLLELINDLLDIAKIEEGKQVQRRVPTDIEPLMMDTLSLLKPRAEKQGINLTGSCKNMKPVYADPKGIEEIFNNLVTNAINYSPEGGKVEVTAQVLGEYMEIKVSDTGVGIDPEELPKIFDKFYRIKNQKTRDVTGTGLGLAIVKGVVESHNGTIDVESVPEKGTTFRILLPVIRENGKDS